MRSFLILALVALPGCALNSSIKSIEARIDAFELKTNEKTQNLFDAAVSAIEDQRSEFERIATDIAERQSAGGITADEAKALAENAAAGVTSATLLQISAAEERRKLEVEREKLEAARLVARDREADAAATANLIKESLATGIEIFVTGQLADRVRTITGLDKEGIKTLVRDTVDLTQSGTVSEEEFRSTIESLKETTRTAFNGLDEKMRETGGDGLPVSAPVREGALLAIVLGINAWRNRTSAARVKKAVNGDAKGPTNSDLLAMMEEIKKS